jgi:hypothetical protein
MAFKLTQSPTYKTTVTVNVPNGSGGFDKSTFVAEFKRKTTAELADLRSLNLTNDELVRKVLVGWEMTDEDTGEAVPFNKDTLGAVLAIAPTPLATTLAYWESVNGARSKN